jgi:epoxyqueuosine reductase
VPVITSFIKESESLGFVAAGFSRPERPMFFDKFRSWLAAGKQGEMKWLGKYSEIREDPKRLLEGCETIITLAYPYTSNKPCTPDGFTAARYTEPDKVDYHDRLRKLARHLSRIILEWYPGTRTRVCVDSAPILERSFAYASGTGFIGKNNMLIVPGHGSYVFLVEILATAFLPSSNSEPMENQCGSCTLCLDACPTGALEGPFCVDASRCLSYLTIEHCGAITGETGRGMGRCFYGCDICQEVCPFNEADSPGQPLLPSTEEILGMSERDFNGQFGNTALARAGLDKVKENIRAVRSSNQDFSDFL